MGRGVQGRQRLSGSNVLRLIFVLLAATVVIAAGCRKKKDVSSVSAANKVTLRSVRLYYESPAMLLVAEPRNVQLPENAAGAISGVARELLKGSVNPALPRLFPADTIVRGAFLLPDGTVLVDLGGATLTQGWPAGSHEELMAIYSLVQTLTANFPEAKRVRLLVNGTPAETLAGHIALDKSLVANSALVDPRAR